MSRLARARTQLRARLDGEITPDKGPVVPFPGKKAVN
jgi:hypothetical protein